MYGKRHILNVTYRDIVKTLVGTYSPSSSSMPSSSHGLQTGIEQEEDPDILVVLDGFKATIDLSLMETTPPWTPTMIPFIRHTVRDVVTVSDRHDYTNSTHADNSNWPPVYAAVHIRGGDGSFVSTVDETIRQVLEGITEVILEWLKGNSQSLQKGADSMSTIGLYVATDIKNLQDNVVFKSEEVRLKTLLKMEHEINLLILFQKDSMGADTEWGQDSQTIRTATSLLGGMLYADIFWDIQVCACAPIGFRGSGNSTFSKLIGLHRSSDYRC